MAHDNLERFIRDNRPLFDDEVPNLKIWGNIERQLPSKAPLKAKTFRLASIAAAVIFLLSAGAAIGVYWIGPQKVPQLAEMHNIDPEVLQMEQFYQSQIQEKYQVLSSYQEDPVVRQDFEQLDQTMLELREELLNAPEGKEEEIIENLIKTYQTKVFILERVLERIQSTNHKKVNRNENEISI
jgi:hypothetical protein